MTHFEKYRTIDHTADLGLEIYGRTLEELFANGLYALFDQITDIQGLENHEERELVLEGSDLTDVFVNFLREILYLFNGEGLLLRSCRIAEATPVSVKATVAGEAFDPSRHVVNMEIKAVTYHQAVVLKTGAGWKGRVICDV
jgi:SHS2 domain-containing protein